MKRMIKKVKSFFGEEKGQGMAEYGLIVVLIAIGVFALIMYFRDELVAIFTDITNKFKGARTGS